MGRGLAGRFMISSSGLIIRVEEGCLAIVENSGGFPARTFELFDHHVSICRIFVVFFTSRDFIFVQLDLSWRFLAYLLYHPQIAMIRFFDARFLEDFTSRAVRSIRWRNTAITMISCTFFLGFDGVGQHRLFLTVRVLLSRRLAAARQICLTSVLVRLRLLVEHFYRLVGQYFENTLHVLNGIRVQIATHRVFLI